MKVKNIWIVSQTESLEILVRMAIITRTVCARGYSHAHSTWIFCLHFCACDYVTRTYTLYKTATRHTVLLWNNSFLQSLFILASLPLRIGAKKWQIFCSKCILMKLDHMLPEQTSPWLLAGCRNLPLKFGQNWVTNSWNIPDNVPRNLPIKFNQNWVNNSWDIADIEFVWEGWWVVCKVIFVSNPT